MHDASPWPSEWPERTPLQTCSSQSYPSRVYREWRSNSLKARCLLQKITQQVQYLFKKCVFGPFAIGPSRTYRLSMDHVWRKPRKWYPTFRWMIKPHLLWFWTLYFKAYRYEPLRYSQLQWGCYTLRSSSMCSNPPHLVHGVFQQTPSRHPLLEFESTFKAACKGHWGDCEQL